MLSDELQLVSKILMGLLPKLRGIRCNPNYKLLALKSAGECKIKPHRLLLKRKLFDQTGDRITPSHTKKHKRLFRYYISNRLLKTKDIKGWRLPAADLEEKVKGLVINHLEEQGLKLFLKQDLEILTSAKQSLERLIKDLHQETSGK